MHSTVWYQIHPLLCLQAHSSHIKVILASSQAYLYQTASLHTQSIESSPQHALKQLQRFMTLFVSSACFFAVSPMATMSHVTAYQLIRFCKSRKSRGENTPPTHQSQLPCVDSSLTRSISSNAEPLAMATLLILLLFLLVRPSRSFNHWVVTEEGKIEYQVRAGSHSYVLLAH